MENTIPDSAKTNFIIEEDEVYSSSLLVEHGNLIMKKSSAAFGCTTKVLNGNVSLCDCAFIRELHMCAGGEIFFFGQKPFIHVLRGSNFTVHISKNCNAWTDLVQHNYAQNITVIRDI